MKKLLIFLFLFLFFINKFFLVCAQEDILINLPSPTPTYILFQDKGSDDNIFDNVDDYLVNTLSKSDINCGYIGQKCCGKFYNQKLEDFFNFLNSTLLNIHLKGKLIATLTRIFGTLLIQGIVKSSSSLVNLFSNIMGNIDKKIFGEAEIRGYCVEGYPSNELIPEKCTCNSSENREVGELCGVLENNNEQNECFNNCMNNGNGVWTAFGCFSSNLSTLIRDKVFGFGLSLAFFVALMCVIYSAFQLQTSQGSAEKIKKTQELLTSCIMGLMLIIFSIFILKIIGINLLKIPGFK